MNNIDKFKDIAQAYFRGNISPKDESLLYTFVSQSEENKTLFRQWEKEWIDSQTTTNEEDIDLCRLHHKIELQDLNTKFAKYKQRQRASLITCLAVLLPLLVFTTYKHFTDIQPVEEYLLLSSPKGEKCNATLYDGTNVMLNSASSLQIGSLFNQDTRVVKLQGEAYFDVAKNEQKQFIVESKDCNIVVKGTKFNITAYPNENNITTTVIEGHVEVLYNGKTYQLSNGQALDIEPSTQTIQLTNNHTTDNIAWTNNRLSYDNIRLFDFIRIIERKYDVDFVFQTHDYDDETITISLRNNESITDVLNAIQAILPVHIKTNEDIIYIY